ncbi:MAG: DivIVA domain-containing protein [Corynebacterium sp.]|nr:DivIVA domain-containing protein [Corynebacterium sp.]
MVTWLLVIIFTALVAWVILATTIRLGGFGEATMPLPKTSELIAENEQHLENNAIDAVRFHVERRGYNQAEVDAAIEYLLQRLAKAEGREMPKFAATEEPEADPTVVSPAEQEEAAPTLAPTGVDGAETRVRSENTLD